jgi:hypothetical protein
VTAAALQQLQNEQLQPPERLDPILGVGRELIGDQILPPT